MSRYNTPDPIDPRLLEDWHRAAQAIDHASPGTTPQVVAKLRQTGWDARDEGGLVAVSSGAALVMARPSERAVNP